MSSTPLQNRLSVLGCSAQAHDAHNKPNTAISSSPAQSFIADFIASSLPASGVDSAKQALSLRTTTLQFTRFVQKAGPIFAAQDAVEKVFRWQDPAETLVCMSVWVLICMFPQLILLLPTVVLATILLMTHQIRFPADLERARKSATSYASEDYNSKVKSPPSGQPPTEGSVDYLQNLQDIQVLMGRTADLTDAGRRLVPYLNWSNPKQARSILQVALVITMVLGISLYTFSHYIDMRYVFLLCGETTFLASHPFSTSVIAAVRDTPTTKILQVRLQSVLRQILSDDALPDEIIQPDSKGRPRQIKEIVVFENERRSLDGTWSVDALRMGKDPTAWEVLYEGKQHCTGQLEDSTERTADEGDELSESIKLNKITPPYGFVWLPAEDWFIDQLGAWNGPAGVDLEGWAFEDADGRPIAVGSLYDKVSHIHSAGERNAGASDRKEAGPTPPQAARRKRRWYRRMVSVPTYEDSTSLSQSS